MAHFDRLGNDMSDDIADALAEEQDKADRKHEEHVKALIAAVRKHAIAHYNEGGWDIVVECWEDTEIREEVAGCATEEEAIAHMARQVGPLHEKRREVWAAGGLDENGRLPAEEYDMSYDNLDVRGYSRFEGDECAREAAIAQADEEWDHDPSNPHRPYCGMKEDYISNPNPPYMSGLVSCVPTPDDEIPF